MMLFGLEGSGFVISLAITLLLTGLIMFYVRQRFSEVQENLDKLGQIVPVMTEQMNIHNLQIQEMRAGTVGATLTTVPNAALEAIPETEEKIDVSDEDDDEDDSDEDDEGSDDDDDDDDSSNATNESPHIKNIQLGSELVTDTKIEAVEPDEDSVNERKIVELDTLGAEEIQEIDFDPPTESDTSPDHKLEVESLSDDDDDDSDDSDDDASPQEVVIKKIEATIESKVEAKPDFSKLSVAALREKASQLNDGSVDVSKMKKKELLKLFE